MAKRRALGLGVILLGALILFAPIVAGEWIIALLGVALVAAGGFQFVQAYRSETRVGTAMFYGAAVVTILLGIVFFIIPRTALHGALVIITAFLLVQGGGQIYGARKLTGADRFWNLVNGVANLLFAALIWFFVSADLGVVAVGVIVGLRLIVEGWTMFLLPEKGYQQTDTAPQPEYHPDEKLRLEPNEAIREIHEPVLQQMDLLGSQNIYYCLTLLGIFFVIHALRTDARWSFLGLISPFAAVVGDAAVAFGVGSIIVLPLRLLRRTLTRPFERAGWYRFERLRELGADPTIFEKILHFWLASRLRFAVELDAARYSLNYAFWRMLRVGLPLTAVFIAINSIWGFSWYFNTENWASGVWQEITKGRVDTWRAHMTADVEALALSKGISPDRVFAIETPAEADGDFSFVVIGDPGEGDASQMSLRKQIIAASGRPDVRFLILSSDVIYPDGKMKDYERNFYLPFMGFEKPIYALPGNHDRFDANEGFNANFLQPDAAVTAMRARFAEDVGTDALTLDDRFMEITLEADRLRRAYGISNGHQRGPYFEMHVPGFSILTVDTGILRSIDERQKQWLEAALGRAGTNFKLVILGHPDHVAGTYVGEGSPEFAAIQEILVRHHVDVTIAGDTHDFEYYKTRSPASSKERLHFVNGGGGAYLSVGTALAFPTKPATSEYAFYPPTQALQEKLTRETPLWKMPFYYWMVWFGGYPFDSETVSGAFDFNQAPFFQSFLEVRVERSKQRVAFHLYGVNGRLKWRDIQTAAGVIPQDQGPDDLVEFSLPMTIQQ